MQQCRPAIYAVKIKRELSAGSFTAWLFVDGSTGSGEDGRTAIRAPFSCVPGVLLGRWLQIENELDEENSRS
jgi:hypothetical protein